MSGGHIDEDDGDEAERKQDRQMIELLNELRVAMPGVQILFGFLLTVPFSQGFQHATTFQKDVFFVTLLLVALSTACLIAPSTAHRVLFHQGQRGWLIEHANRMLIGGALLLALALVGAVLLVTDYLFDGSAIFVFPPLLALTLLGMWFIWPLLRRRAIGS
jgi:Family of unknown function (DUF6328)